MDKKRVMYLVLFIVVILGVGGLLFGLRSATQKRDSSNNTTSIGNKNANTTNTSAIASNTKKETKEATVTVKSDGTFYSITSEEIKPDIVIGDNYFDTQLSDINKNFSQYAGKIIEIEGFYIENTPFTFVSRYSKSNLCQYCPEGYSYFEYEWKGDKSPTLQPEQGWLKIVGELKEGKDSYGPYYYIDAFSIGVMNERGLLSVEN